MAANSTSMTPGYISIVVITCYIIYMSSSSERSLFSLTPTTCADTNIVQAECTGP